ncbi:MAG TPA: hypothetical protein VFF16_21355 [Telluria sp.]|nr:hypothetical protein [Telluria sp.]
MDNIEARIRACELENERLRKRMGRTNALWLVGLLLAAGGGALAGTGMKPTVFDSIRAREVVVVDGKGIVRARLAGDMPDAVMAGGHVSKRGSKAAGVMLYDEEGIERGGYVTMDEGSNVLLTLDSKYRQATMFVAGPDQSQTSALRMWAPGRAIELRNDENGARLSVSDQTGVALQQPAVGLTAESCKDMAELEHKYPSEHICRAKFTEAACNACLGAH